MTLIKQFEDINPLTASTTKQQEDKEGIFRVEKIMLRRIRNTMTEYLVKWQGKGFKYINTIIKIPEMGYKVDPCSREFHIFASPGRVAQVHAT